MLEYAKTILEKVSFNNGLFQKELTKFQYWLNEEDKEELTRWCAVHYGKQYPHLLKKKANKVQVEV